MERDEHLDDVLYGRVDSYKRYMYAYIGVRGYHLAQSMYMHSVYTILISFHIFSLNSILHCIKRRGGGP